MPEVDARKTLYIETTIPSYATAHDSRDIVKYHRQIVTRAFWESKRRLFRLCTSRAVLTECADGDPDAMRRRQDFMKGIYAYPVTGAEDALAAEYQRLLDIPDRTRLDCVHLAVCVTNKIDYLLTWNCKHLGPVAQEKARVYNDRKGLWTPVLVTPETIAEVVEVT